MAKIGKPIKRPTNNSGFCGRREAAPPLMANLKRRNSSALLAASVPAKFMELRPSMCRSPIGDPQHCETFRFCGSACPSGASYCTTHAAIAHASTRPGTPRKTKFQMRPPAKVRVTARFRPPNDLQTDRKRRPGGKQRRFSGGARRGSRMGRALSNCRGSRSGLCRRDPRRVIAAHARIRSGRCTE